MADKKQVALLPVLFRLDFALIVSTNGAMPPGTYAEAVREALIGALPTGTGVGGVSCSIDLADHYSRDTAK